MSEARPFQGMALSYGADEMLLQTRERVLEVAGYIVTTVRTHEEMLALLPHIRSFDVIVFCHTIPAPERDQWQAKMREIDAQLPLFDVPVGVVPENFLMEVKAICRHQAFHA